MKLSDYIVDYLASLGTKHIFTVTGGAIAHVVDSIGRRHRDKGDIDFVCVQHEQAGAMAAEAYSRLGPGPGIVAVTSGPGATNLITGICGAWFDSIPCLFISGQVNTAESIDSIHMRPRQVGFQETDIVSMVKPITKFAHKVTDPKDIRYYLEKATHFAYAGRPGPVLLDIPVDVQIAEIELKTLTPFIPGKEPVELEEGADAIAQKIGEVREFLAHAKRPIVLLGGGVRLAGAEKEALRFAEMLGFPIVVSWSGFDLVPHNHPLFVGHIGVYGNRGANFALQNSDLLISLGSRLDTRQTGGRRESFARAARKVLVDIDPHELHKERGLKHDIGFQCNVKRFLAHFLREKIAEIPANGEWLKKAKAWSVEFPACLPEYFREEKINAYVFMKTLSDVTPENEIVIVDEGGNLTWTMQSWEIKKGQRLISTFGNSPMGYALPAAMGASLALGNRPVICIDGDGGFQMNIQELQTVVHYKLPIKIFILNNFGYGIIKQFQDLYFESRYEATGRGYSAPDFARVAEAYGIPALTIAKPSEVKEGIRKVLGHTGPILCNVLIDENQKINPKLEFGRPIEDMAPYLSDEEFAAHMIVEPLPRKTGKQGWQKA